MSRLIRQPQTDIASGSFLGDTVENKEIVIGSGSTGGNTRSTSSANFKYDYETNSLRLTGSFFVSHSNQDDKIDFTNAKAISGSVFSGSFVGDGGGLSNISVVSSSYALSASYAVSASVEIIKEVSSSFADTAASLTLQPSIHVTNITASGNISSSGTIKAPTGSLGRIEGLSPIVVGDPVTFEFPITGSIFSGSFTGSFAGDGSQLTNVLPAGVLSSSAQIADDISGSFGASSASFSTRTTNNESGVSSNEVLITNITSSLDTAGRMVFVGTSGALTSEAGFEYNNTTNQLNVENLNVTHFTASFITSSTIETSGSNIFGDEAGVDIQTLIGTTKMSGSAQITGSLNVKGNITGLNLSGTNTGDQDLSGLALKTEISGAFNESSASFSTRVTSNESVTTKTLLSGSGQITAFGFVSQSASIVDLPNVKIQYANVYDNLVDLPAAADYHGMFAHVHGTGKGYYAHAGSWIELANISVTSSIDSNTSAISTLNSAGLISSSAQIDSEISGAFTEASGGFSTRVTNLEAGGGGSFTQAGISGSWQGQNFISGSQVVENLPSGLISGSAQIESEISGAFAAPSNSIATEINDLQTDSGSFSTRINNNTTNINTLNGAGLISGSAQIESEISGAFTAPSNSIASEINGLQIASGSFSTRVTNLEAGGGGSFTQAGISGSWQGQNFISGSQVTENLPTGILSGSAQIESEISGAFSEASGGFSTRITNNTANISTNTSALSTLNSSGLLSGSAQIDSQISGAFSEASGGFSTRITNNTTSIGTLNSAGLISGSAQIESEISGAFTAPSNSIAAEINALQSTTNTNTGNISTNTSAIGTLNSAGLISSSAQIESEISGAFTAPSNSIATEINSLQSTTGTNSTNITALQTDSASFSTRVTTLETNDASGIFALTGSVYSTTNNLEITGSLLTTSTLEASNLSGTNTGDQDLSSYALISAVSGAFTAPSNSIATEINSLQSTTSTNTSAISTLNSAGLLSGSAQIETEISGAFTAPSNSIATEINSLQSTTSTNTSAISTLNSSGLLSGSAQIETEISGAFSAPSNSIATEINSLQSATSTNTSAISTLNSAGLISGSVQIETEISGAFTAPSNSIATEINTLQSTTGTNTSNIGTNTSAIGTLNSAGLISGSGQIESEISGAFTAPSNSIAAEINTLQSTTSTNTSAISTLNSAGLISGSAQIKTEITGAFTEASGGFSTRVTTLEAGGGGDTYSINVAQDGDNVDLTLDAASGTDSVVQFTAGSNITLTRNDANQVTIASSGGGGGDDPTDSTKIFVWFNGMT
tara:strand:- start:1770 stop:5663 length:3894 start_codon:yes stop_codon:yes gene_type:complete